VPADRLTGTLLDYAEREGAVGDVGWRQQFRPGVPAQHPVGVHFQGPWDQPADGFHEHVRRQVRALALVGCPVHLTGLRPLVHYGALPGSEEEKILAQMAPLTDATLGRAAAHIQMTVPGDGQLQRLVQFSQSAMRVLGPDDMARIHASRVLYTVWERYPAPEADVESLNRVGQCWTACEQNRRMLIGSGVAEEKVRTVPLPYFDDDPLLAFALRAKKPRKIPRFYHIGKWEPRKDQHRMIGCFLRAFRPAEAELYLKTSRFAPRLADYPQGAVDSVRFWMTTDVRVIDNGWRFPGASHLVNEAPLEEIEIQRALGFLGLKIYDTRLSEDQIRGLHGACDVYLSLSHGEGWDMPAFDAKLAGNRMIYTMSGGPQDFSAVNDFMIPVKGDLRCHPLYRWPDGSLYVDHADAKVEAAMAKAADQVRTHGATTTVDLERFRAHNVGKLMLKHLRELASNLPGEA
jgi:hypothetical protein